MIPPFGPISISAMPSTPRPWVVPSRNWMMSQTWNDLLFLHWPIPQPILQKIVPPNLPIDTYRGQAWLGIVPFTMSHIHFKGLPPLPGLSAFPEINVRTYVTLDGKPGVYFFSLDAENRWAVWFARNFFNLPYFYSEFSVQKKTDSIDYQISRRRTEKAPLAFEAQYGPTGQTLKNQDRQLAQWLTARYCLYTTDSKGRIYRGNIDHSPWPLQPGKVSVKKNTLTASLPITLPKTKSLVYFSKILKVNIWGLEPIL
ncbi:MAG TPA: DUF2071 domain-containing protein [bacterium]|jgi:uncharacterized protein YqjF (DUF2071 family)|nr:DUF2071 domain-containing protein [bacterium]